MSAFNEKRTKNMQYECNVSLKMYTIAPGLRIFLILKNYIYYRNAGVNHKCDALHDLVPFLQFKKCEEECYL